jgi:hypothetical protein
MVDGKGETLLDPSIRLARPVDAPAIQAIYAHELRNELIQGRNL